MGRQLGTGTGGVEDVWLLARRSPEGTRRAWRQREELQVILRGAQGPQWWEIAPALAVLLAAIGLPLAMVGWLWVEAGWWAGLLATAALAYAVRAVVRRRREVAARKRARRTAARFTLADVDAADDRGYRRIVGRLLVRDGWQQVRGVRVNDWGAVHLVGEAPGGGQQLGVAFERGSAATDGDGPRGVAALRPVVAASGPARPAPLLLVVSSGHFSRERVVWAARTGVRLVDRGLLARWAAGERLPALLDLDL